MAESGGAAELMMNEVPDLSLDGAAAATPKCQIDPKASAAGDYGEGDALAASGSRDGHLFTADDDKGEEATVVSEQIELELHSNQHEQNIIAIEDKDEECPPSVGIEPSLDGKRQLPTVVIEDSDGLQDVELIDVDHLTDSAICDDRGVSDSAQIHSPDIVLANEELSFMASCNEEKYHVGGIQAEPEPLFTCHDGADDIDKGRSCRSDERLFGEQILEDSGQLLTNSAVLEASFTSHDDFADIGDIDIGVDAFLPVDGTAPVDLLAHTSDDQASKVANQPSLLPDVQCSLSDPVTVTNTPLAGGANYIIDVGDKALAEMTKPSEENSQTPTGIGDVISDMPRTTDGESGAVAVDPMVAIDAECENIVITSISDVKHDCDDEEFDFEVEQNKDIPLPRRGSGEHTSLPKVVDLIELKKSDDFSVPATSEVSQPSSSGMVQDEATKSEALREAEEEWATVEDMTAGFGAAGDFVVGKRKVTVLISYDDALDTVCRSDITRFQPHIHPSVRRRGFAALKYILCGPPPLHEDLLIDRDLAFCMAACPFSNDDVLHLQVLQTIYRGLTGSSFDCPRYGSHWEQIGFQGTDPATDLRGAGFLALLHLLYAVTSPRTAHLIHDIYKLSHDEVQNFPLCIMSINMTRIAVQALREGCLNKLCNHGNQVVAVLSDFYLGTFQRMYHIWKHERKTIRDSGFVLQDVEKYVKKHPAMVLRTLEASARKPEHQSPHPVSPYPVSPHPVSPPNVTTSPLRPEELDEYINERYPSPEELDMVITEDASRKNFFSVCKDDGDDGDDKLGNLI